MRRRIFRTTVRRAIRRITSSPRWRTTGRGWRTWPGPREYGPPMSTPSGLSLATTHEGSFLLRVFCVPREFRRCIITRMKRYLLVAVCLAAAVHVSAQQRAPQIESIRQEDLRADLYFLAGDSLRGRLTDTEENRAAADFIRSRFERMGLNGAGPNGSYFQPYNLMTATVGDAATNDLEIA